jgi:hypothetical protein
MFLRGWRFLTILLASLSLGMSCCHVLEMPARRSWDADLWVATTVHGGLYRMFGPAGVGPWIDGGAILAAAALVFLVRKRLPAFWPTLAGAACLAAAQGTWWALVFPANLELADWLSGPVPLDWAQWRDRWEFGHAAVAAIKLIGFAGLVLSVLVETPTDRPAGRSDVQQPEAHVCSK